jgi:predicted DNA-binding transcriptional regulator AlpA
MSDTLPDVLLIPELSTLLRLSTRTIERRLRAGVGLPPEMRRISREHRWLKADVLAWMQQPAGQPQVARRPHFRSHLRVAQGGR